LVVALASLVVIPEGDLLLLLRLLLPLRLPFGHDERGFSPTAKVLRKEGRPPRALAASAGLSSPHSPQNPINSLKQNEIMNPKSGVKGLADWLHLNQLKKKAPAITGAFPFSTPSMGSFLRVEVPSQAGHGE
jgi:hypothetical protein